jgi:hypothetical protein
MVKVIAYCLFYDVRTHPVDFIDRYMTGLFETIRTRDLYFYDWNIHITYDKTLLELREISELFNIVKILANDPSNQITLKQNTNHLDQPIYVKAGHRFLPITTTNNIELTINDEPIEYILFRDIDSPLTQKDKEYVEKWTHANNQAIMSYSYVDLCKTELEKRNLSHIFRKRAENSSDEALIEEFNKNKIQYLAGGLSINIQLLSKLITLPLPSYFNFTKSNLDNYKNMFKNKLSDFHLELGVNFDEYYLANNLKMIDDKNILKIPMMIVRDGGKWYDLDTIGSCTGIDNWYDEIRHRPLLDFI